MARLNTSPIVSDTRSPKPRPKPMKQPAAVKAKAKPPTDMQLAQQQIAPLLAQLTGQINQRAQAGANAIRGYTGSLAHELAGIDYGAPYRGGIEQQAATDAALRQSLAGQGSQLADSLRGRLAQIGDPSVEQAAGQVAQTGAAAGTTQQAYGSAALAALIANEAAAGGYGAKMPGVAQLSGLQGLSKVESQASNDLATQTGALTAKVPDIVAAVQANRAKQQQLSFENRLAGKEYGLKALSTNANVAQGAARVRQGAARVKQGAQSQTERQRHDIATEKAAQARIAASKAKASKPKPLTASDKARLTKQADDLRYGIAPQQRYIVNPDTHEGKWTDVPGTETPNASYQEAYAALVAAGAPPAYARAQVNRLYKPGEYGRPASAAQQAVAASELPGFNAAGAAISSIFGPR